jgi:DNA-directed RNA polymerase specialized sigma24 family protein
VRRSGPVEPVSEAVVADVNGYLATLPAWAEFAPPMPARNSATGPSSPPDVFTRGATRYTCTTTPYSLLALDEALNRLAELDERKARVIELRFFGGMTHVEAAAALGISEATVERELRLAKAWLAVQLDDSS